MVSMKKFEFSDATYVLLDEGLENDLLHETCKVVRVIEDGSAVYKVLKKMYEEAEISSSNKEEAIRKAYSLLVTEWANRL